MREKYQTEIEKRISEFERDYAFTAVDFADIADTDPANKALSRLSEEGTIKFFRSKNNLKGAGWYGRVWRTVKKSKRRKRHHAADIGRKCLCNQTDNFTIRNGVSHT